MRATLALLAWASLLPAQAAPDSGFDATRLQRVPALLQGEVAAGHHAGVSFLLLRNGREVQFGAFGFADVAGEVPFRRDTIVRLYSMTKAITSVAALALVEQQSLRLDEPVAKWLPELAAMQVCTGGTADAPLLAPAKNAITLRMLLNHTAGFTYGFFTNSPVQELYRRADLWSATSCEDFLKRLAPLPLLAEPGEQWNYSVADDVLGVWIERASGKSFAEFVRANVTAPLGMVDTDFDVPEGKRTRIATMYQWEDGALKALEPTFGVFAEPGRGFDAGGAGLFSTIDDYARFCRMLLGNGELDGVRILGRKTMELAGMDSLRGDQHTSRPGDGWGLVCAVRSDPGASPELGSLGMLHWSGAATTHFFVDPQEGLVGLLLCQHQPYDQHRLLSRFHTAVYQALR
ncbi:MAG: serine hydrolase domain-containing protein [Planctomycetota bacterium]